jgi:hypothetical protein
MKSQKDNTESLHDVERGWLFFGFYQHALVLWDVAGQGRHSFRMFFEHPTFDYEFIKYMPEIEQTDTRRFGVWIGETTFFISKREG